MVVLSWGGGGGGLIMKSPGYMQAVVKQGGDGTNLEAQMESFVLAMSHSLCTV